MKLADREFQCPLIGQFYDVEHLLPYLLRRLFECCAWHPKWYMLQRRYNIDKVFSWGRRPHQGCEILFRHIDQRVINPLNRKSVCYGQRKPSNTADKWSWSDATGMYMEGIDYLRTWLVCSGSRYRLGRRTLRTNSNALSCSRCNILGEKCCWNIRR